MAKYLTKQRKILQEYLAQHIDQELSVKKVVEDLSQHNISLSAVYRNLADMEKEHIVVQCPKEGSREFYFRYLGREECLELFHISCKVCNKTEHLTVDDTKFIQQWMKQKSSFELDLPSTVFYGVCYSCQQESLS